MIRRFIAGAVAASFSFVLVVPPSEAQHIQRTGSRVASDATPRTVYQFEAPRETERVLRLLEQGRTEDAVELARDYLASLRSAIPASGTSLSRQRYHALNALCVALTKAGRVDEAVATCTDAVEMLPSHWTALNSRATAYYVSRQYDLAAADYQRALDVAPDDDNVLETLEHNIRLTAERIAAARDSP